MAIGPLGEGHILWMILARATIFLPKIWGGSNFKASHVDKYWSPPLPPAPIISDRSPEYCYYSGNNVYLPSVHRVLVCGRDLRPSRGEGREDRINLRGSCSLLMLIFAQMLMRFSLFSLFMCIAAFMFYVLVPWSNRAPSLYL